MIYGDFIDFTGGIAPEKALHNEALNIVKKLKYDGYQR